MDMFYENNFTVELNPESKTQPAFDNSLLKLPNSALQDGITMTKQMVEKGGLPHVSFGDTNIEAVKDGREQKKNPALNKELRNKERLPKEKLDHFFGENIQRDLKLVRNGKIDDSNKADLKALFEGKRQMDRVMSATIDVPDFHYTDNYLKLINAKLKSRGLEFQVSDTDEDLKAAREKLYIAGEFTMMPTGILTLRSTKTGEVQGEPVTLTRLRPTISA